MSQKNRRPKPIHLPCPACPGGKPPAEQAKKPAAAQVVPKAPPAKGKPGDN